MPTKSRPAVMIDIGGKIRKMVFDLNAMATYEEITGKNILTGMDTGNLGAKDLRALIYACLSGDEPELTIKDVGSWITPDNMYQVAEKITEAFRAAVPEADGKTPLPRAGRKPAG